MKSSAARARVMNKATVKVSVEVMSWLKEDFEHEGWDRLVFDQEITGNSSIMDLLQQLAKKYPRFNQKAFIDSKQNLLDYSAVVFNGTFLSSLQNLDTELKEGDNI
ncbi:MAG: MoaD/ThiS family protein, partial [Dehalococcoidia bacterium]|nr:MoaD/ThiS family protein [Dehalococcoidia bacterium]